jgi:glucosamine--fructose-6-phosphate aminotransferase (isomerizing)
LCGIFGLLIGEDLCLSVHELMGIVNNMFKLSESRGKEASGVAIRVNQSMYVFKEPVSSSRLVKSGEYRNLFNTVIKNEGYKEGCLKAPFVVLGHSRLATNGLSELNSNNQPVVKDGAVGIHNGIIVNDGELWKSFPELERKYDVDTEVFLSLLQMFRKQGESLVGAVRNVFGHIEGSASVAILFDDINNVLLATNTGSLYTCSSHNGKILVFASEKYILGQIISSGVLKILFDINGISQVKPGQGYLIDLDVMKKYPFALKDRGIGDFSETVENSCIKIVELYDPKASMGSLSMDLYLLRDDVKQSMMRTWENLYSGAIELRRCSRCLLPETMPFISFDEEGVCSYCRAYENRGSFLKGEKALEEFVSKYRSASGEPDVIVGFSGGRDSSYGLDYFKNYLKMHPIVFTYDWGMVNDLARRNQARVCGRLGVEQIVVSADIKWKRGNIRRNLKAWLKKPDLGMVPLLMAGDKQFYYYFHKVRKQTGVKLFVFCGGYEAEEGTGLFKYGFCKVNVGRRKALSRMTGISFVNKLKIMSYYVRQYLRNPAYINRSILDTLFAYYSSYVLQDDYLYLYHYLDWDEEKILSSVTKKFDWERETDTIATWRIDDGTAPFYNYIYMTMAGFTEFDIFRSHQIREGKLSREEAYELVKEENKPRFKSIEWYGQAIDFDMNRAIEMINSAPKLYKVAAKQEEVFQSTVTGFEECQECPVALARQSKASSEF